MVLYTVSCVTVRPGLVYAGGTGQLEEVLFSSQGE